MCFVEKNYEKKNYTILTPLQSTVLFVLRPGYRGGSQTSKRGSNNTYIYKLVLGVYRLISTRRNVAIFTKSTNLYLHTSIICFCLYDIYYKQ